jgi:hypothetical protein
MQVTSEIEKMGHLARSIEIAEEEYSKHQYKVVL